MNKYPQGYLPKIKYWANQYAQALNENNWERAGKAWTSLLYFQNKEEERMNKALKDIFYGG
jgi:hypothetical protein